MRYKGLSKGYLIRVIMVLIDQFCSEVQGIGTLSSIRLCNIKFNFFKVGGFFLLLVLFILLLNYKLKKAWMLCLGFKPGAAGWIY